MKKKQDIKKIILNPWMALFTLSLILLVRIWDPQFIESVRLRYFDQLITSQPSKPIPVHVVHIDEDALDKYGQFPFPRNVYAEILEELYKRDAGVVVFNILTPEADRFKGDSAYAEVLDKYNVVLPSLASVKSKNTLPETAVKYIGSEPHDKLVEFPGMITNIPLINNKASGIGMVNTFPEIDGVVRRMPLILQVGNKLYPSLSLETLRVASNDKKIQVKISDLGVDAVKVPTFGRINTDSLSRIWVDYSVKPKEYSLSALPANFDKEIVIVGVSAAGLVNPVSTSKGEVWPQTIQASVVGTMLTGATIQRPDWADTCEILLFVVAGIILIGLMRWMYLGIAATLIIALGSIGASIYVYTSHAYLFDITLFVLGIILVALHAYIVKFLTEFFLKQQIKKQFSSYLSPDLVAKLIKDPSLLKLGGEEKELSIMFTDVRGFTGISEHYGKDVQGLTSIMNRYMTAMTRKILENSGTLDKYIGDAQMAFWNAPLDETKHCKDAVKAALEMLDDLKNFNDEIASEGVPPFGMGIGINTGTVVVGNMGSEQRFDYTCLGDAVNLASRLEGQSKPYGVKIVIGPVTAERLGDEYFTLELDCIAVKGKKEGVRIYTVFTNPPSEKIERWNVAKENHNIMLRWYRQQKWDMAINILATLVGEFDGEMDSYYEIWLDRIRDMQKMNLQPDWDGVYRATSK